MLKPFLPLLPGIAGFSLTVVLPAHIAGSGRPSINLAASSVALVVTLALGLTLISAIAVPSAAVARSTSHLTTAVVTAVVFSLVTHASPLRLVVHAAADVALLRRVAGQRRQAVARP